MDGPEREAAGRIDRLAALVALALLAAGVVLVLWPFFSSLLWAAVLTSTTWPLYARLESGLGGRRSLAALLMTLLLAAAFLLPLALVGLSLAENLRGLLGAIQQLFAEGPPMPPAWLERLPVIGPALAAEWRELVMDRERLAGLLQNLWQPLRDFLVASGVTLGTGLMQLTMSVLAAFVFYRDGSALARFLRRVGERVAGPRFGRLLRVAETTLASVVFGAIGTAIVQALLAFAGFLIAGVPGPFLLGFATFFLALFPAGAPIVWLPVAFWLYQTSGLGWGLFMLLWGTVVVSGSDNLVRPYLISRGSELPFLLVLMGVVGGALAFGFLGIFLGPTLLALALAVVREWGAEAVADGGERG